MTIRARRRVLVSVLCVSAAAFGSGCYTAQSNAKNQFKVGRSEPARVQTTPSRATESTTAQTAQASKQRTILVASDHLGGRIFPDATLPATATTGNTAVANVPTQGE